MREPGYKITAPHSALTCCAQHCWKEFAGEHVDDREGNGDKELKNLTSHNFVVQCIPCMKVIRIFHLSYNCSGDDQVGEVIGYECDAEEQGAGERQRSGVRQPW